MNREQQRRNLPVWFEIPVSDMPRAIRFYETLFQSSLIRESAGPMEMAIFPRRDEGGTTGCLAQGGHLLPGDGGTVVYLNADPQLDQVLARVRAAGGEVLVPRTELPDDIGCYALFRDSEGNRVGLHALA
ncbi:MAG: VOC family protein [Nevskia sp.]|nr:VOC family protein [Nevskia sp.]